ncbi:MAG TPA: hypothetical protein VM509_14805, partial [Planctomycetota bacterium]|nr:hypothetical protein [Planctomycetota bacterium]
MDPQALLFAVLASAAVAGGWFLITWGLASSAARADATAPPSAAALAIGLAALAGFGLHFGWNFRPNESWRWLIWVFPLVGLLGALDARIAEKPFARWALRVALIAIAVVLVL